MTQEVRRVSSGQAAETGFSLLSSPQFWVAIILAIVAGTVLVVIGITLAGRKYWKMASEDDDSPGGSSSLRSSKRSASYDIEAAPLRSRQASFKSQASTIVGRRDLEVARSDVTLGKLYSSDETHDIFEGQVVFGSKTKSVYLRQNKGDVDKKKIRDELSALKIISDSPHIVPFLGMCVKDGPYYLIFAREEMSRLDVWLKDLYKAHRPLRKNYPDFNISTPLMPQLLQFGIDVVNGLHHLSSVNCIAHHPGAKNVVITEGLVAKIADYPPDVRTGGKQPRSQKMMDSRWMAFETLLYNTYSTKSTVWSCGLILWEIMSYGQKPFSEIRPEDIWQHLASGNTLPKPAGCPDVLFDIIKRCLLLDPKDRLSINLLVRLIETKYNQLSVQTEVEFDENTNILKTLGKENSRHSMSLLETLATVNMMKTRHVPSRMMAIQYAAAAFSPDNVCSKFVLLQACGDENEAVARRASHLLDKHILTATLDLRSDQPLYSAMPSFTAMVKYVKQKASEHLPRSSVKTRGPLGVFSVPFTPVTYQKLMEYIRMSLAYSSGQVPNVVTVAEKSQQAPKMRQYINSLNIQEEEEVDGSPLHVYVGLLQEFVSATGNADGVYQLLEVVAMAPDHLAPPFVTRVDQLRMLLQSEDRTVQQLSAQLLGIVLCYAKSTLAEDYIRKINKALHSPSLDIQRASLWSLGYIICNQMKQERDEGRDTFTGLKDQTKLSEDNIYRLATEAIVTKLQHNNLTVVQAACTALSVMAQQAPLPLPKGGKGSSPGTVTQLDVLHLLSDLVSDTKLPVGVREESAAALANHLVGDEDFPYKKLIVTCLTTSVETCPDDIYLQLKFADSLVMALEGYKAYHARNPWRDGILPRDGRGQVVNGDLEKVCDALFRNDECQESASIFFLVLIEAFKYNPYIQSQFDALKSFCTKTVKTMEESGALEGLEQSSKTRLMECLLTLKG